MQILIATFFAIFVIVFIGYVVTVHGYPVNSNESGSLKVAYGEEQDFGSSNVLVFQLSAK